MRSRRFLLLSAVLVTLNAALWLTPQGLALRQVALPQLFGKNLMRAEVKLVDGQDWRVDRGVITQVSSTQLTLKEADTHLQTIGISNGTNVIGASGSLPLSAVTRGWRALVTWQAGNGIADVVKLEKKVGLGGGTGGQGKGRGRSR
jgi:hypothetical protein